MFYFSIIFLDLASILLLNPRKIIKNKLIKILMIYFNKILNKV